MFYIFCSANIEIYVGKPGEVKRPGGYILYIYPLYINYNNIYYVAPIATGRQC